MENKFNKGKFIALDEIQENINKYTKEMILKFYEETWTKHSTNVILRRKCNIFYNEEYNQCYYHHNKIDQEVNSNVFHTYSTHGLLLN